MVLIFLKSAVWFCIYIFSQPNHVDLAGKQNCDGDDGDGDGDDSANMDGLAASYEG